MIPLSIVRLNAQARLIEMHPELNGLVTFDASQPAVWPGMALVELRITAVSNEAYTKILEISKTVKNPEHWGERRGPLANILDHYCVCEDGTFELNGYVWHIGDGDDSLALAEIDMSTVTLWVRTWWEKATA